MRRKRVAKHERVGGRSGSLLLAAWALLGIFAACCAAAAPAFAQRGANAGNFLTPFPERDTYRIVLVGGSLARQLAGGLVESLAGEAGVELDSELNELGALMSDEAPDEVAGLATELGKVRSHVAVVMMGLTDRRSIRITRRRVGVGEPEWRERYAERVEALMKALRKLDLAVYWVGLPIVRRDDWNEDVQMMNDIVRERAFLNGVKIIDIYKGFADESGDYDAYGPDVTGANRLLRERDGVHFTWAGTRKLAHFVVREIRRDIAGAKAERAIPLAGDATEQQRIAQLRQRSAPSTGWQGTVRGPSPTPASATGSTPAAPTSARAAGQNLDLRLEQRADHGRIQLATRGQDGRARTVTVEIVRPAIPAAVVALVTRRESAERASLMGETVADAIATGATVMSSITLATEGAAAGKRGGRAAAADTPYFRVLVKGERLAPRPDRADHLPWPPLHETERAVPAAEPSRPPSATDPQRR
jgi:hypothetical protein